MFIAKIFSASIFSPLHLLWINLITDAIPAMTLGFEEADKNIIKEKPRKASEPFFNKFLITRIIIPAVIKSIIVLTLYFSVEARYSHEYAMTVAFITLSFAELLFSFVIRSDTKPIYRIGVFSNPQMLLGLVFLILVQLCVLFIPSFSSVLGLKTLDSNLYILSIGMAVVFMFIAEITKVIIAKAFKKI